MNRSMGITDPRIAAIRIPIGNGLSFCIGNRATCSPTSMSETYHSKRDTSSADICYAIYKDSKELFLISI